MNIKLHTLIAATGLALTLLPSAGTATTAKQFIRGGEFCFRVGTTIPGGWSTRLKMVVSPAHGTAPYRMAHVDALEHATQATFPQNSYFQPMIGSATIAAPSNQPEENQQLLISLTGADVGFDVDPTVSGLWSGNMALILSLTDLSGHMTGVKDFTPVKDGQLGETAKVAVDETIAAMPCDKF